MDVRRFFQVSHFSWIHSKDISKTEGKGFGYRLRIYMDMIYSFLRYRMWSNQYVKELFWTKNKEERELLGAKYLEEGIKRDAWQKDFRENRKFLIKYSNIKYEGVHLRYKRNKKYAERYHTGQNFVVEYDVHLSRQHYLDGSITIGDNVLLSKHVTIDYSGDVVIMDNVKISDGVIVESHAHSGYSNPSLTGQKPKKESLIIEEGCVIGTKSIILESCHRIGRHARIGAGSVIRFDIPPYAIVIGNPCKIVGFAFTPKQMQEFELNKYPPNQRVSIEEYEKLYVKYFLSKLKDIKKYIKRSI